MRRNFESASSCICKRLSKSMLNLCILNHLSLIRKGYEIKQFYTGVTTPEGISMTNY